MKAKTKAKPAPAETEPPVPENIDKYVEVACSIVAELGDFLRDRYDVLTRCTITMTGKGITMEMPKASVDPQTAANIHRLMNACDSFTNAVRGNY
jgi:hypothetical protein